MRSEAAESVMNEIGDEEVDLRPLLSRLGKDLKQAAAALDRDHIRWLVDEYYTRQEDRKRSSNQVRSRKDDPEPNALIDWLAQCNQRIETVLKSSMGAFATEYGVGRWMLSLNGVGPVISAGMLCHFDIRQAPNYGHYWSFAGLCPNIKWEKKTTRPWNAKLKTLVLFRFGQTQVKFCNHQDNFYGKKYADHKTTEWERNLRGGNRADCDAGMERVGKTTESWAWYAGCYDPDNVRATLNLPDAKPEKLKPGQGIPMLPPMHVHNRAVRWAAKLFVSHLWEQMYYDFHGRRPEIQPYPVSHLGHSTVIPVPNQGDGPPHKVFGGRSLRELYEMEK